MFSIYKCFPGTPDPVVASTDLNGEIPSRSLKYCEPFLVANRSGILVFPPIGMTFNWTGSEVLVDMEGVEETILVDRLFLPDSADYWERNAPEGAEFSLPPLIEAFPERGVLQIWSGLFVSTPENVSTWVRGPVNRNTGSAHSIMEGVVETDWWTGPLFCVVQLTKTDFPIALDRETPFLQIVPLHRPTMEMVGKQVNTRSVNEAPNSFWGDLVKNGQRRNSEPPGSYRREAKRRAKLNALPAEP